MTADADPTRCGWLTSTIGAQTIAQATDLLAQADGDQLRAASGLRALGCPPALATAALTQAVLRRHAAGKFGPDAAGMFFTRSGLEQATRAVVARRRAARLAAAGARRVADLGCGIGADTLALARAGIEVLACELDPATAAIARANVAAAGLADRATVVCADATSIDLSGVDAVFCDPARRDAQRGERVWDPARFRPPWSFVSELPARVPMTVLKLAPGVDHSTIDSRAEAEWVSVDGDVVEAAIWFGPLATVSRRASVLRAGRDHQLTGSGAGRAPTGPIGRVIYEPDGAVVRSHLVAEFADSVAGRLVDPHIAYVFADSAVATPYARCLDVVEEVPLARKRLRSLLHARGIGVLEILKRGVSVDPAQLRRELRLSGPHSASLVVARVGDRPMALLCQPNQLAVDRGEVPGMRRPGDEVGGRFAKRLGVATPPGDDHEPEVAGGEDLAGDVQWMHLDRGEHCVADPAEQFGEGALLGTHLPHPHDHR